MHWLLICFFVVIIFSSVAVPVFAATAAPNLPLESMQGAVSDLYSYSLQIVGLCVFIVFLIAGLRKIVPDSMWPNALSAFNDPKETIINAVIGMVLLFSAYLILNTINPDLVGGGTQQSAQTQTQP